MDNGFFEDIELHETELSTGKRIRLPVRFFEWSSIMAHFPAPASNLRRLLPSDRLKPALLAPGTGILTLVAMEYKRISDVAPYNELGIAIPVLYEPAVNVPALPLLFPHRFPRFGLYIHHLPVTTQEAYDYGVELWGYPKFVAEITFEEDDGARRCRLRADGQDVLTVVVDKRPTRLKSLDYHTYTVLDGQLLHTRLQTQGQTGTARFQGGASFALGDHPIADELRSLEARPRPVEVMYSYGIQSLLHPAAQRLPL
ncbi:MAG: acetoacetate decarboxylase family protein [Anaerolineae bacterium]|nr:acetoacetate decarboxylase family protein [Anaerolineae bacterium]